MILIKKANNQLVTTLQRPFFSCMYTVYMYVYLRYNKTLVKHYILRVYFLLYIFLYSGVSVH